MAFETPKAVEVGDVDIALVVHIWETTFTVGIRQSF